LSAVEILSGHSERSVRAGAKTVKVVVPPGTAALARDPSQIGERASRRELFDASFAVISGMAGGVPGAPREAIASAK
jgi:hypothetical protein